MIALAVPPVQELAEGATSESFRLLDLPAPWVVVLVVLPAFAFVAWLGYARESIPTGARTTLGVLRFVALALLGAVLCRPVLVQSREEVHPAEVVVLVDDSASMRRKDSYAGDAELRDALAELVGGAPDQATRTELVQAAVEQLAPEAEGRGYVVRLERFSDRSEPLVALADLTGRGHATHVGDAVDQGLAAARGRNVTDVVVLSDGRSNGGAPVLDVARAAGVAGVPVHTVVVGDTRPERNALVELVEIQSSVLEGDEVEVVVRARGRGTAGGERAQVLLEELDQLRDDEGPVRVVAEEEVELGEAGERVVLVAPPAPTDVDTRERRFRVSVTTLPGETHVDDNELSFSVHVSPQKIRVLYVDGYPRWEYRRLKDLLLRADENIEVQCFLLSATSDFTQEHSPHLPALQRVPTTREELLDSYDVVILGDVPYEITPDPAESDRFHQALVGFVEAGGGVFFQSGEFDNPRAYAGTPLEDLLPVLLPSGGLVDLDLDTTRMTWPSLENPGTPHEIVRLVSDIELNRRLWEDPDGLQGFYWYQRVARAKPGTQVLLRHPSDVSSQGRERYPLLVAGYYPSGRTMFFALDSTWRWQFHWGKRYRERFWRNAIRWLALGRLKSGDRRFRLETPRGEYDLDERVALEARVLDEDFHPLDAASQEIVLESPDGRREFVTLPAVEDRAGLFRTTVLVERPGLFRAWFERDGERLTTAEFEVVLPSRENDDPSPDPDALRTLATLSGGIATDLGDLDAVLAQLPGDEERREPISSRLEDAWDRWLTLVLALLVLSAEWILRKRWEMV